MKHPSRNRRPEAAKRPRVRHGFTLIEVLVSIALLAIVIPVGMSATASAMKASSSAKHRAQAAALCEAKMAELVIDPNLASATLSGNFGDDNPGYQWEGVIDSWSEGTTQMQQLQVIVTWGSSGRAEGSVILSTLVAPASTDTGATQ